MARWLPPPSLFAAMLVFLTELLGLSPHFKGYTPFGERSEHYSKS